MLASEAAALGEMESARAHEDDGLRFLDTDLLPFDPALMRAGVTNCGPARSSRGLFLVNTVPGFSSPT